MRTAVLRVGAIILTTGVVSAAQSQETVNTNLGKDANGNSLRLAVKTGHVSNYDEDKVKPYTLPDPLVFANGAPVADAAQWEKRPEEVIRIYETEIFGRIPSDARKVTWTKLPIRGTFPSDTPNPTFVTGKIGDGADAPRMMLAINLPPGAKGRVPVILALQFGGGETKVP